MDIFRAPQFTAPDEGRALERLRKLWMELGYSLANEPGPWVGFLRRSALARGIRGSNSIEGYRVSDDDAMAVVDSEAPFEATAETLAAVRGYRNAMGYVLRLGTDPHALLDVTLVRSLHYIMMGYATDKHPGAWRPGPIYVTSETPGETAYTGPEASLISGLMDETIKSLEAASQTTSPMIHAAMAHLNLAMIHPFSDGNGRMARCLQTLVLARAGIFSPVFASVEEWLGANTPAYYAVLAEVGEGSWNPGNSARPWIRFMLTAHYQQARTFKRRIAETALAWAEITVAMGTHGIDDRAEESLVEAAFGARIRNERYRRHAGVSALVATKDLKRLVDAGLLVSEGERRGRVYRAGPELREIRERCRQPMPCC